MDLAIVMIEICPKDLRKKLAQMGSNQIKLNGLYVFLCLWSQPDPQRVCPPSMKLWSTWGSGKEWFWIYVLLLVGILYSWTYLLVTVCVCVSDCDLLSYTARDGMEQPAAFDRSRPPRSPPWWRRRSGCSSCAASSRLAGTETAAFSSHSSCKSR